MKKNIILNHHLQKWAKFGRLIIITLVILITSGCTMFKGALDKRTGFSSELANIEKYISDDNWEDAEKSMAQCMQKWEKIKPWLQLELDHDVVNEIEARMTELTAYLETEEKPTALANARVIINYWADIGSK